LSGQKGEDQLQYEERTAVLNMEALTLMTRVQIDAIQNGWVVKDMGPQKDCTKVWVFNSFSAMVEFLSLGLKALAEDVNEESEDEDE
jgi:hypothetical protein